MQAVSVSPEVNPATLPARRSSAFTPQVEAFNPLTLDVGRYSDADDKSRSPDIRIKHERAKTFTHARLSEQAEKRLNDELD